MQAGKRDRPIQILRQAEGAADGFGHKAITWAPLASRLAAKEDIRDRERLAAQEVGAEIDTRFQVMWDSVTSTITAKDRIQFGARVYDIVAVKEIGRREGVEITACARAEVVLP